ncbi:hypothetical protein C9J44_15585 [Photobacterium sp. GB-27]|uniref:hypothetical protein n=1 Tax=Photobacterium sp. GB-27 TaxID=2022109 RepID=UPI000D16EC22|nr:hypothetical protein [Photobacterium sp. GB-27]PSV34358.1 hypothetical protein C9J44_15585 [Photobacterium sp. GB-27]
MLRFKICLALLLSYSINVNGMEDCGDLYDSFVDKKKKAVDFYELGLKRDEWIKTHLDIHFDYEDGSSNSARTLEIKTAIVEKLKLEPALYSDDLFMPTAIYELSRYWSYQGVDVDTEEVFTNMTRVNKKFLFQDIEGYGMSTAVYVLTAGNYALMEAMYQPLGEEMFSLESLSPLYPELTGSDLRKFYFCRF